jgi:hypothetical protein
VPGTAWITSQWSAKDGTFAFAGHPPSPSSNQYALPFQWGRAGTAFRLEQSRSAWPNARSLRTVRAAATGADVGRGGIGGTCHLEPGTGRAAPGARGRGATAPAAGVCRTLCPASTRYARPRRRREPAGFHDHGGSCTPGCTRTSAIKEFIPGWRAERGQPAGTTLARASTPQTTPSAAPAGPPASQNITTTHPRPLLKFLPLSAWPGTATRSGPATGRPAGSGHSRGLEVDGCSRCQRCSSPQLSGWSSAAPPDALVEYEQALASLARRRRRAAGTEEARW